MEPQKRRGVDGTRRVRRRKVSVLFCLLAALVFMVAGCAQQRVTAAVQPPKLVVETGKTRVAVQPDEPFLFTNEFDGAKPPVSEGLARSSDGRLRISLGDVRQPVICTPAPYAIRQQLFLPPGARLRLAFGLASGSWNKRGPAVRFLVRVTTGGATKTLLSQELGRWENAETANWSPVTLDLPAGEIEVELVTESVGKRSAAVPTSREPTVAAYALWVNPKVLVEQVVRPNIVIVLLDALRADHLGCYGYRRETSPFLDSLAARAVVFDDANSQATWTMPSVQSLLTSSYRLMRGSRIATLSGGGSASEEGPPQPVSMPVSLQGQLCRAGYDTMACVGGGFLDPALGFDAGFDWYWSPNHTPMLSDQLSVLKGQLSGDRSDPFFLFLHTYEVHNYFQEWGHDLGLFDRGYLGPLTDPRRLADADLHGNPRDFTDADMQFIEDLYDGEIHHTDRYLGIFFNWLFSQPWGRNTIIVIFADHGEGLGDHGVISHGGVPYYEIARVPLIVFTADGRLSPRRIGQPVALADLMPTLLNLAGVPAPGGIIGRSLLPVIRGEPFTPRPLFSESRGSALMAREGEWWYVTYRGERPEELYDRSTDPAQVHNLAVESPAGLARMREVMADLVQNADRGYRLAIKGSRREALTVTIEATSGFAYFDMPTRQKAQSLHFQQSAKPAASQEHTPAKGQTVIIELPAGDDTQVVLFEPANPGATVIVSAQAGGRPVERERLHIGAKGRPPVSSSVEIGAAARTMLRSDEPPVPDRPTEWGIWLWLPSSAAEMMRPHTALAENLPKELREQLKSLGYLR